MEIKNIDGDVIIILNLDDLKEANLRGANLRWSDLKGANLEGADLEGADLRWSDLYKANLYKANLIKANLIKANLTGANLREVDLREVDLRWSDLTKANLIGADLTGVNLIGADLGENVKLKFIVNNFVIQLIHNYLSIGCKTMLTKEFIKPKIWKKLSIKEKFNREDVKIILKKVIEFLKKERE